jgi:ceramide glucosyltransferase
MISMIIGMLAALSLAAHLGSVGLFLRRLGPGKSGLRVPDLPPITLLRPVCGVDAFDPETLETSFRQDYPEYEVLFCAGRADDPAVALVRRLIARNPHIRARLLIGTAGRSGNPKLDNLWKGWQQAGSDWICMADSNLLLPDDYLRTLMQTWTPQTGMVSSPAIGTLPQSFGGSMEASFLNSNQARLQFAGDSLGLGFAQGKTLFFNRLILERAGGLAALDRFMAEDASATVAIRGLGLKVSLPRLPFAQPVGAKSMRQVWTRQLRWSRLRRDAFPMLFLGEIANGAVLTTVLAAIAIAGQGAPLWLMLPWLALWYGAEVLLMRRAGWPAAMRDILALPLRDGMLLAIWAATLRPGSVEWRGTVVPSRDAAGVTA